MRTIGHSIVFHIPAHSLSCLGLCWRFTGLLGTGAERKKDFFFGIISDGRPDLRVKWQHGSTTGKTEVENNTYHAVWMSSLKIPYEEKQGFTFEVWLVFPNP